MIEDTDMMESKMNGEPYMATRFAATLRRRLWKEHLGLLPLQHDEAAAAAMKPVGTPHVDVTGSEEDQIVMVSRGRGDLVRAELTDLSAEQDPLNEDLEKLWRGQAERNAAIFDDLFHCVPSPHVETWQQYADFVPQAPMKAGHVARPDMPVQYIKVGETVL